jgi:two-component system chemotaxis response regulator CheY
MLNSETVKVLVADDTVSIRQILKSMLREMGFRNIIEAADGTQTAKMLGLQSFQLILCDWEMPGHKGDELLEMARKSDNNKDCVFIMCTGNNSPEGVKNAIALGVSNFVIKPFNQKILREKLEKYFNLATETYSRQ